MIENKSVKELRAELEKLESEARNKADSIPVNFPNKAALVTALVSGRVFKTTNGNILCFEEYERDPFRSLSFEYQGKAGYRWVSYLSGLTEVCDFDVVTPWYLDLPEEGVLCNVLYSTKKDSKDQGMERVRITQFAMGDPKPFQSVSLVRWAIAEPVTSAYKVKR